MSISNLVTTTTAAELCLALNPLFTQPTGPRYSVASPNPVKVDLTVNTTAAFSAGCNLSAF